MTRYAPLTALSGSMTVGHVAPYCGHEVARRLGRVVGQHADDGQAVGGVLGELGLEQRELVPARDARRAPEVDEDRLARQAGEVERRAVEGRPRERRRGIPDRGVGSGSLPGPDEPDEAGADGDGDEHRHQDRFDAAWVPSGYWIVAVPVMAVGWTMHRNL